MIVLSNTNAQVIPAGQSATFNVVLLHTGCAECHRANTGSTILSQRNAIYEISYNANIGTTAAGTAQVAVSLNGSPLMETTAISQTAAAGDLNNVAAITYVKTCCCESGATVLLTNTGTEEINMGANPKFSIKRVA